MFARRNGFLFFTVDLEAIAANANAYDAMRLVALAIGKANSTDGDQVRQALENIERYDGLIKSYAKPFTPDNHDALNENDYIWVRYNGDDIVPVATQ